jgi:hypothetical protein
MDEYEENDSQTIDTFPTFGDGGTAFAIPAPSEKTLSFSGFFNPNDAGQVLLRTHGQDRTPVNIQILWDGTNGYQMSVRVASRTHGASATGGPQTQTFEFAPNGAATIVGTGPLP